jgi:hypothetical protein
MKPNARSVRKGRLAAAIEIATTSQAAREESTRRA